MSDMVTLTIDGAEISVPKGTLVVDAAKKIDIDIPVFCYHPKLTPVGMCRMCLVEIGLPVIDRATGQKVLNPDGSVKLNFGKGLQTGCTVVVSEGMVVRTATVPVQDAREDIIEFLLTSHPLDCPVCDKGGECPLQNLTLAYGRDESRMYLEDKMKLAKHVPLGELIVLDRERCIQCARCTRFRPKLSMIRLSISTTAAGGWRSSRSPTPASIAIGAAIRPTSAPWGRSRRLTSVSRPGRGS